MRFNEITESSSEDRFKKYIRPVVKTTPKIEKTTNPSGRTTDHIEWKVTGDTGEIRRFKSKKEAQEYYDLCTKKVTEAGSSAQQAAIAIAMKKAGKKPKQGVAEGLLNELDMFAPVTTYVRLANGEYVAASWRRNQDLSGGNNASFIDIKPLAPNVAKQLGLDKRLNDPDKNQNSTASIASGGGVQSGMPFSDKTIEVVDIMDKKFASDMGVPDAVFGKIAQWSQQQGVAEAAAPVTHRIGLTVTDPNHPMVSKRKEPYQKSVRVTQDVPDREAAINQAIAHHRRKGYKVHDHHYLGTVDQGVAESNEFTDARMNAIKASKDTFVVHGKTYKVTGDTTDEREASFSEGETWSKHNNPRAGGMSKKSVASYRRSHPGSKIQTAVTTKPSKLKKGSKAAKRRASFCARMRGMKKHRTGAKTANDPNSNINKSLRRWHCESIEELHELVMLAEQFIRNKKNEL